MTQYNPLISDYIKTGASAASLEGTTGGKYVKIPLDAIGLPEADGEDAGEFLNALLRTVSAKYDAAEAKPEHMTVAKSTYVPSTGNAERTYSVKLDITFGDESVVDESAPASA